MNAKAQNYLALPDSNATWIIMSTDGFGGYVDQVFSLSFNKQETSINSKTYTIFPNEGFFRNDSLGRTYFIPQDSTQEYILQDLSKNAGDSIYNVICSTSFPSKIAYNFYVDSVNHINIGPYSLKRMYLTNGSVSHDCNGWKQLVWIEKVGSLTGGFFNLEPCYLGAPGGTWLACMSYNDTTYYTNFTGFYEYPQYSYGSCHSVIGISELQNKTTITLSPNPNNGNFTITNNNPQLKTIHIYNVLGEEVKKELIMDNGKLIMDVSNLPSGIYLVKVSSEKEVLTKRMVKE